MQQPHLDHEVIEDNSVSFCSAFSFCKKTLFEDLIVSFCSVCFLPFTILTSEDEICCGVLVLWN